LGRRAGNPGSGHLTPYLPTALRPVRNLDHETIYPESCHQHVCRIACVYAGKLRVFGPADGGRPE